MKLMRLTLENFQGIKDLKLDLNGANASIYGDNATGKTTIFNAFTWLLFGRSSTNSKGYTPKTRTAEGEAHNLNHIVEAEIMDGTGQIVRLKKTYHDIARTDEDILSLALFEKVAVEFLKKKYQKEETETDEFEMFI